ncbi:RNA polymerase-binding transcription factor DksA [Desulfosarcina alkanivorans]|uniref:RNA polymerase-binding transcription factor DksA n=1 Tax=Desulfosarcina alkanivorans TaxID=571177 RepID=A0A5K7YWI2_9BACT|nr:TraR/DksA C4-type zinc finger protein [Desulfosarcina alkanivorans]BBO69037.1 RNA polymerase-binding transcription factor DksA [Desulfosarcina alkanivorans]
MKKKDLDYFQNILQRELEELLAKADLAVEEILGEAMDTEADPLDRATEAQARNNKWRFRDRERRLIGKIQKRLQAIDDGTYGICENCEEPIGLARLKARSVTSYCIDCKTEQETLERITGS